MMTVTRHIYREWELLVQADADGWFGAAGDAQNPGYIRSDGLSFETGQEVEEWLRRQVDTAIANDEEGWMLYTLSNPAPEGEGFCS